MTESVTAPNQISGSSLKKRNAVFSIQIGDREHLCVTDDKKNPYSICMNTMAVLCNTTDNWSTEKKRFCQSQLDNLFGYTSPYWQAVRKECGPWKWNNADNAGSHTSSTCASANTELIGKAYYKLNGGTIMPVAYSLTDSLMKKLWSNPKLFN